MRSDNWLAAVDDRLARQLRFLLEADRLKGVIRGSRIADGSRRENTWSAPRRTGQRTGCS